MQLNKLFLYFFFLVECGLHYSSHMRLIDYNLLAEQSLCSLGSHGVGENLICQRSLQWMPAAKNTKETQEFPTDGA